MVNLLPHTPTWVDIVLFGPVFAMADGTNGCRNVGVFTCGWWVSQNMDAGLAKNQGA